MNHTPPRAAGLGFPLLLLIAGLIAASPVAVRADLNGEVRAILQDKILNKAEVGVEIVRLTPDKPGEKPQVLFRHNSDIPLIPASNLKLATTSATLEKLGPNFKFRTALVKRGEDLILVGDGDPTFGDSEFLRKVGWDVDTVFKNWADTLKKQNITSVRNVLVDDSVFDEEFVPQNWPVKQQHLRYVAQVGGVNLNANCIDFYLKTGAMGQVVDYAMDPLTRYASVRNQCVRGRENSVWLSREPGGNQIILRGETNVSNVEPVSVTIHDPPMFAATVLAETLEANGVHVSGNVDRDRTVRAALNLATRNESKSDQLKVTAVHETPLASVLKRANTDSMNLYAECLCKRLGYETTHQPGSWASGTAAVRKFLTESVGINGDELTLDDGCGLSKKNGISANALAQTLVHNFRGPNREAFISSLAIGGVDGTLDHRFLDDLRGRVFAKSGFVNNVSCLSGYVHTRDDQWFCFSILMNNVFSGGAKQLQERVVKAIDQHGARG